MAAHTPGGLDHDLGIPGLERAIRIGSGGFGTVFRAEQPRLDRTVAVKVLPGGLDDDAQRRFEREATALGRLSNHPNIVTVFDSGETTHGQPYLVMEYVRQGSAADLLRREGPLSWDRVLDLAVSVCGALATAHAAGIMHRDVKPENILLSDFGDPMICDFGIARLEDRSSSTVGLSGTLAHLAPELLHGAPPTPRSDLYSLGSTLFTLLHGSPAFAGDTDPSPAPVYGRILNDPVPDLRSSGVPDAVCSFVERLMDKSAEERPSSAVEAGETARSIQSDLGAQVSPLVLREPEVRVGPDLGETIDAPIAGAGRIDTPLRSTTQGGRDTSPPSRRRVVATVLTAIVLLASASAVVALRGSTGTPDAEPSSVPSQPAAPAMATADGTPCAALARSGSDPGGDGSEDAPFRTLTDLIDSLEPAETGCLAGDRFEETVTVTRSGRPGEPIVLAPLDGERPLLVGALRIGDGVADVTFRGLRLEGAVPPAVVINGDRITIEQSVISNASGTCVYVGSSPEAMPRDVVLRRNRIHACGPEGSEKLELFAISSSFSRGLQIVENVIADTAQRGVVLYPDADGATITRNTFHATGTPIDIGGNAAEGTSGNLVISQNVFGQVEGTVIKGTWEGVDGASTGTVAFDNCLPEGVPTSFTDSIVVRDTVTSALTFQDPATGDLRLPGDSPCAGLGAPEEVAKAVS